jgi:hypothetical protein
VARLYQESSKVKNPVLALVIAGLGLTALCSPVSAQLVTVNSDIAVSTTWGPPNTYKLVGQIYVLPGATLTIQEGTIIASVPADQGALAVTRGAQIHVLGTPANPVIMTSTADTATWVGGDPKTGTWRAAAQEWGNLTVMGNGYMCENQVAANTLNPNLANYGIMEGLLEAFPGDPRVRYGGGDDYDDSGEIRYLSLRYGGKVIGSSVELNGLSLGAIGRGTDIHHVEVMNNIDDGVEIWGGTVNVKYLNVWNVGDDSIDVDQGWRGKIQFGLLVQGFSLNAVGAGQGGGVGDNCFETDGAEDSFHQPVTTSTIYNMTVIGQPGSTGGDHGTAWRDNARIQYRNCIFMDLGERLVGFDNSDGDTPAGAGYGAMGTLNWPTTWNTAYTATSAVNPPVNPGAFYTVQTSGNLCEIKDSVFFNNNHAQAYTEASNIGGSGLNLLTAPGYNNVQAVSSPITSITRAAPTLLQGGVGPLVMSRVTFLNPAPANDALVSVAAAPNDGFFTPANYRGAFPPATVNGWNWLCGWTASTAYGFTPQPVAGPGQPGVISAGAFDVNNAVNANGCAVGTPGDLNGPFYATGTVGGTLDLTFYGEPNQPVILFSGAALAPSNFDLGLLAPFLAGAGFIDVGPFPALVFIGDGTQAGFINSLFRTDPLGRLALSLPVPAPALTLNFQAVVFNSTTFVRATNSVQIVTN